MARELNRELFGERTARPEETGPPTNSGAPTFAKIEDLRRLSLLVESLNKRAHEFEAKFETLNGKVEESTRQNKQRFERVQGHFQNQNEVLKNGFSDFNNKIAQVASRVNERKVADSAIKDMVDRHNQVVQSFEVRLNQVQRLVGEQELQLMNARSELKQALHELTRLKKL